MRETGESEERGRRGSKKIGKLLCLLLCLHAPSSLRRSAKCQENERHVQYTIKDLVIKNMPIAKTDVSFLSIYLFFASFTSWATFLQQ